MENGKITMYGLVEETTYIFWVFHDDTWYDGIYTIGKNSFADIEIPVPPEAMSQI